MEGEVLNEGGRGGVLSEGEEGEKGVLSEGEEGH